MSVILKVEMPEGVFSALRMDSDGLIKELRLAAAIKWYEIGIVSQEKAAEIAGISRQKFIFSLSKYGVSPFQYTIGEIKEELNHG